MNHAIFASEEVIVSRLGVKDAQQCPFKDSNVAAILLTTPCRVSGDHPSLTLFAKILLPWIPHPGMWAGRQHSSQENTPCSLSPLERGFKEERMTKVGWYALGKSTPTNPTRATTGT